MTSQDNEFTGIITRALTENTAQSVLNHLTALESNRAHVRTRWVWELLQNARDACTNTDTQLVAAIEHSEGEVVFRHNGGNFKREEIIHLIYHGSTKVESEETLGRYGSGFLTTHLLSPEIGVSGQLDDGRTFSFQLKRELGSVDALINAIQSATNSLLRSLSPGASLEPFSTEFRYPLREDSSDVVVEGIATLLQCAPYVVAFNREFSEIRIDSSGNTVEFKVMERSPLNQAGLERVTVSESHNNDRTDRQYLVSQGENASIAVPVEKVDDGYTCLPLGDLPRLFLGFPLIGTEHFSFPAAVNSFRFTPTENRDGVFLWQASDPANQENQSALAEACGLLVEMLQFVASSGWHDAYRLAEIPDIQTQNWLNEGELRAFLVEQLVESIRVVPAVVNESGETIHPKGTELAIAETAEGVVELWSLLVQWLEDGDIWPRQNEAVGWCNAVRSWARLANCDVLSYDEVIDGRKLASIVDDVSHDQSVDSRTHRIRSLEKNLKEGTCAISWLDRLIGFLRENSLDEVIREYRIVPSQEGFLRTLPRLHRDMEISGELKNVARSLGWRIRPELRDLRITAIAEEPGAGSWDNEYVVEEVLRRLRERAAENPDEHFGQASVNLFTWLVQQDYWNGLRSFPAFARGAVSDRPIEVIYLPVNDQGADRPLAPVEAWADDLRPFVDLFPPNRILADDFTSGLPDPDIWQLLVGQGVIQTDIIATRSANVGKFYPDLPLREGVEHTTAAQVPITDIWRRADIMERVRDSQTRARLFWRFLTEWLAPRDVVGLEIKNAECVCGDEHRYYPAAWLEPLRENTWVRMSNDARTYASDQSLANLLRGTGWEPVMLKDNTAGLKLLEAIGISRLNLVREFVASDDNTRWALDSAFTNILETAGDDLSRLAHARQFIEDLKDDQDLPDFLADRRERRRQVHDNQRLGDQVEVLVKQSLEGEGFTVHRTRIGSDFAIEFNDVTRLCLNKSDKTWLVEVKATRDNRVRMTAKQAATAVETGEYFLLCVVPVEGEVSALELDTVRASMRFVADMGPRVEELCENLDDLETFLNNITADESSGVRLEVDSGAARVRVENSIWDDDGFPVSELLNRLN